MSKAVTYGKKVMDAVDASVAQVSEITVCGQLDKLTYQCKFSAPASGTFTVEAKSAKDDLSGTWYALDFGTPMTISAETDVIFNLNELPFSHIRLNWGGDVTNAGTMTVIVAAKSVGV